MGKERHARVRGTALARVQRRGAGPLTAQAAGPARPGTGGPGPASVILNGSRTVTWEKLLVTSAPAHPGEWPTVLSGFSLARLTGSHHQQDLKSGHATGWLAFAEAAQ